MKYFHLTGWKAYVRNTCRILHISSLYFFLHISSPYFSGRSPGCRTRPLNEHPRAGMEFPASQAFPFFFISMFYDLKCYICSMVMSCLTLNTKRVGRFSNLCLTSGFNIQSIIPSTNKTFPCLYVPNLGCIYTYILRGIFEVLRKHCQRHNGPRV